MTRPAACEYGPTGHCRNGTHSSCAHRPGGPMEHGSWAPECYLSKPPKGGHKGTNPIPASLDHATVFTATGTSVIRPSHVWHCTCDCHRTTNPEPIIGQLDLFEHDEVARV